MSSIKGFFNYLENSQYIQKNPTEKLPSVKKSRKLPSVLSFAEIDKILNSPDTNNILGLRDKAILELFYSSGLRVSELINIKINDGKRIAYVEVPTKEKGLAIGRDGKNIEKVKKLSLRHHNINDVIIQ